MAIKQRRPELHQPVLDLIKKVNDVHTAGGGEIALSDVINLFGVSVTPEQQKIVTQRGALTLTPNSSSGGAFSNSGSQATIKQGNAEITIPATISGSYTSNVSGFLMNFDKDHRIHGRVKILGGLITVGA